MESENEFKQLIYYINNTNSTNIEIFSKLSEYTYLNYSELLSDVLKIFPTPVTKIYDWRKFKHGVERSNIGLELELVIVNYLKDKGLNSELIIRGRGKDIKIGDLEFEIKSSSKLIINNQLQTTFYKNNPKKFYLFISNSKQKDIEIRIVSSQLLYRISLGEHIFQPLSSGSFSEVLDQQIDKGLQNLDFKNSIMSAIEGKELNESKSFSVGNNVNVRFLIYFEPSKH